MNETELLEKMRSQIALRDPDELALAIGWRPGEPAKTRRPHRWRRLVAGVVVTAGLAAAAVVGPSVVAGIGGSATSYASSAIDIRQENGQWVARIKDPLAEHAEYAKAFRAVGLDVDLQLVPVSPSFVGDLVRARPGPKPAGTFEGGLEPSGCKIGEAGCHLAFRVPVGFEGDVRAQLGRPAEPGEVYLAAATATMPGEVLEGVRLEDRTVGEVLDEVRKRDLQVVYELVKSDPGGTTIFSFNDGRKGVFRVTYVPIAADAVRSDWLVWRAVPHSEGVVKLVVTPQPLEPDAPLPGS
ncbi:hypothetical protein ACTWPT_49385 [Nonomuraea sp. 3N208]|uniref:hypothetical protein n=1 Tax=Nonomuraea sp. 3N208 TaxID=3457421 RepID=UPI003FCFA76F